MQESPLQAISFLLLCNKELFVFSFSSFCRRRTAKVASEAFPWLREHPGSSPSRSSSVNEHLFSPKASRRTSNQTCRRTTSYCRCLLELRTAKYATSIIGCSSTTSPLSSRLRTDKTGVYGLIRDARLWSRLYL